MSRRRLVIGRAPRTRSVLLATGLLVVGIAPFGIAATGDSLREGRRNGTTVNETEIVSNIKSTTALKGGYSTRQSNLSDSGGGAIYGCRSQAGGSRATPTPQNPCIRANNLSRGLAFEFNASVGDVVGSITSAPAATRRSRSRRTRRASRPASTPTASTTSTPPASSPPRASRRASTPTRSTASTPTTCARASRRSPPTARVIESRGLIATQPGRPYRRHQPLRGHLRRRPHQVRLSYNLTGDAFGEILASSDAVGGNTAVTVGTADSVRRPLSAQVRRLAELLGTGRRGAPRAPLAVSERAATPAGP